LDVHKDSIDIAVADAPRDAEIRYVGRTKGDLASLGRAVRKLVSRGQPLHIVYEAGPCGFVIQRHLARQGLHCEVVAPSSIARPPGERVKTDRRDATLLTRLARSGDLVAVREQRNGRYRLKALLLRNGIPYTGKTSWTPAHLRWLAELKLSHTAQQIAFHEYLHAITQASERIVRLEQALRDALTHWRLRPVVQALQALRGVQLIAAMTLAAQLQDFLRFESPRQLMAYLGLVPSESSSGAKRHRGAITNAGNSAARRMLVEVA